MDRDIEEHSVIRLRFNNYDIANTAPIEITFSQVANKLSVLGNYPLRDTDEVEWQFPRKWYEIHQSYVNSIGATNRASEVAASKLATLLPFIASSLANIHFTMSEKRVFLQLCLPVVEEFQDRAILVAITELLKLQQKLSEFRSTVISKCVECLPLVQQGLERRKSESESLKAELTDWASAGFIRRSWTFLVSAKSFSEQAKDYERKEELSKSLEREIVQGLQEQDRLQRFLADQVSFGAVADSLIQQTTDREEYWNFINVDVQRLRNALCRLETARDETSFDQHSIHITEMCRNLRADLKSFCPVTAQDFDQGNPAEQDGSDAQRDQHSAPGPTKAFWRRIFKKKKKIKVS